MMSSPFGNEFVDMVDEKIDRLNLLEEMKYHVELLAQSNFTTPSARQKSKDFVFNTLDTLKKEIRDQIRDLLADVETS